MMSSMTAIASKEQGGGRSIAPVTAETAELREGIAMLGSIMERKKESFTSTEVEAGEVNMTVTGTQGR